MMIKILGGILKNILSHLCLCYACVCMCMCRVPLYQYVWFTNVLGVCVCGCLLVVTLAHGLDFFPELPCLTAWARGSVLR